MELDAPTERIVSVGGPAPAPVQPATRPAVLRSMLSSMFWDVGLAVVCYYGARLLGAGEFVALMSGTMAAGLRLAWVAARARRLDPFALFLMLLFGAGLVLTLVTGDPRFVLVKDSFTTGLAGLMFLGSCCVGRPLTYHAAQRMVGAKGGPDRWQDPAARRGFYQTSLLWGGGLLAEALLRIPLIYLLPLDVAVGASSVLMAAAYAILIALTMRWVKRATARP